MPFMMAKTLPMQSINVRKRQWSDKKNLPTNIYRTRWQVNDHNDDATTTPWQLKCYVASCNIQSPSQWPQWKHHNNYDVLLQVTTHDHHCNDHDKNIATIMMFCCNLQHMITIAMTMTKTPQQLWCFVAICNT